MSPPAEAGKANAAVIALLAGALAVPRRRISLTSGHSSRDKVVALEGLSSEAANVLLAAAAETT